MGYFRYTLNQFVNLFNPIYLIQGVQKMSQTTLVNPPQVFDIAYELENLDSVAKSRFNIQNTNIGHVSDKVYRTE